MAGLSVRDLTQWMIPRMTMAGCNITDIERALSNITSNESWTKEWGKIGEHYLKLATLAERKGNKETAYQMFFYAMIYYYEGQKVLFEDTPRKMKLFTEMMGLYENVVANAPYPIEKVEINHEGSILPGYLHKPSNEGNYPCLIFIQGMDSSKEEWHVWGKYAVERGFALLAVDTPGHGETRIMNNVHLDIPNVINSSTSCRKFLTGRDDIISDRIGILGNCLGSNYAFQSAAKDAEFACCLIILTIAEFKVHTTEDDVPAWFGNMIKYFTGDSVGNTGAYLKYKEDFKLEKLTTKVHCPTHLFHPKEDNWLAWDQVDLMGSHVDGSLEITPVEGKPVFKGNSMSHLVPIYEQIHWVLPVAFDWVKEQLCKK